MAIPYSDVSPFATNRLYTGGGEAVYDRNLITSAGVASGSGAMALVGFVALHTETCNNITIYTAGTAAGATPTLCKMGVYQSDNNGNLTLLASTANDTTLFSATFNRYIRPLNTQFNKVANSFYMLANLVVSAAAMPQFAYAFNNGALTVINQSSLIVPITYARVQGLADLPLTVTPAQFATVPGSPYFMEVLP